MERNSDATISATSAKDAYPYPMQPVNQLREEVGCIDTVTIPRQEYNTLVSAYFAIQKIENVSPIFKYDRDFSDFVRYLLGLEKRDA